MNDKRLIKKVRRAAICYPERGLSIQYAEVLRLRQAVSEAEARFSDTKSGWEYESVALH